MRCRTRLESVTTVASCGPWWRFRELVVIQQGLFRLSGWNGLPHCGGCNIYHVTAYVSPVVIQ